jgi:hypothetical protein
MFVVDVTVEADDEGNIILPLPEELLKQMNWSVGDTLTYTPSGAATPAGRTFLIEKKDSRDESDTSN